MDVIETMDTHCALFSSRAYLLALAEVVYTKVSMHVLCACVCVCEGWLVNFSLRITLANLANASRSHYL